MTLKVVAVLLAKVRLERVTPAAVDMYVSTSHIKIVKIDVIDA